MFVSVLISTFFVNFVNQRKYHIINDTDFKRYLQDIFFTIRGVCIYFLHFVCSAIYVNGSSADITGKIYHGERVVMGIGNINLWSIYSIQNAISLQCAKMEEDKLDNLLSCIF